MVWQTLLFVHWPVPPAVVRQLVPPELELDTHEGSAWVGLVPFTMPVVRALCLPPVPSMRRFHECNVRTYVTCGGEPGVYFFSLDAASHSAVWGARRFWHLPYHYARIDLRREGDVVHYSVDRSRQTDATLRCVWRIGAPRPRSLPGSLDHFLTERYMIWTVDGDGRPRFGRVRHEPWMLRDAEMIELNDNLVRAAGISVPDEPPVVSCANHLEVLAWPLEL
jgi:uncharacterized protein YqjF (DUF2071 family)